MIQKIYDYSKVIQKWSFWIAVFFLFWTWLTQNMIFAIPARIAIHTFGISIFIRIITQFFVKDKENEIPIPTSGYRCPKCYSEYNSDVEICFDCNIALKELGEEE